MCVTTFLFQNCHLKDNSRQKEDPSISMENIQVQKKKKKSHNVVFMILMLSETGLQAD